MDHFDRLLGHDRWTTDHLMELSLDLTDEQLDREFDIGHRTLRTTFDHIVLVIEFWTDLMDGTKPTWEPRSEGIDPMRARLVTSYDRFETLARKLEADGRLDETFGDHYAVQQSYGATILHVILHSVHHRSEVLHILQRLGKENLPEADPQEWEYMTGITKQPTAQPAGQPAAS